MKRLTFARNEAIWDQTSGHGTILHNTCPTKLHTGERKLKNANSEVKSRFKIPDRYTDRDKFPDRVSDENLQQLRSREDVYPVNRGCYKINSILFLQGIHVLLKSHQINGLNRRQRRKHRLISSILFSEISEFMDSRK